jgi:hypothetical protein
MQLCNAFQWPCTDLYTVEIHPSIKFNSMSKDKGGKNAKKAPASKLNGKVKAVSDYKMESKTGYGKEPTLNVFAAKPPATPKGGGSVKPK